MKTIRNIIILVLVCGSFSDTACQDKKIERDITQIETATYYMTAKYSKDRLSKKMKIAFAPMDQPEESAPTIIVDPTKQFQTIEGFGGAFTDAAAINYTRLPEDVKKEFIEACFDAGKGNGYTLCRTTIHSSDFSAEPYTYDDVAGDKELKNFSIDPELEHRIPFIKDANKASENGIKIFASPWSPPAWMKTNDDMLYGGKLLPEYRDTWANYIIKYLSGMEKNGIDIWGLTVQNEPMAVQVWESCVFTAEEERDFVRDYLGPVLYANDHKDIRLMIWDHNRGIMYQRAQVVYDDPEASKYVWGTGFHYYVGDHFDNVRLVHDAYPDKKLLYTEAGLGGKFVPENIYSWDDADRIAISMINDLNNWAVGWVHWNLLLDEKGGPCHVGHDGMAPIMYDFNKDELIYRITYFYFGHFSRFIKPGARRIICSSNFDDLMTTGFINPDGSIAVIALNTTEDPIYTKIWLNKKYVNIVMPRRSVITVVI